MAGKRGGRGGSAGAKRPAVEAEQGLSSLKIRIKRSNASKDIGDSKEALLNAELDNAEEHEDDAANVSAKNPTYWLKILCFIPGDPKAKSVADRKIQQLKGDIMIKIEAGDSINDLIPKLTDKVVKRIGGCPAVWEIALQAEGSHAGMFKESTRLELDGNEEAEEAWDLFLEELVECGNGKLYEEKEGRCPRRGGRSRQDPNEIVASAAGKTVTAGHMDKNRQLTSKYICEAPACPNKKYGIHYCWHPYWAPQQHLPMSNQPTKKEDKRAANSWPKPETEIDCETEDANLDDIEQDVDDDEIQIIKTVLMEKIPRPLKQEPVLKKEPLEPQLSIKKAPKDDMPSIEPLLAITNRSPAIAGSSTSALLASIQDGPRMPLKDWYEEYDVPYRTQAKLEEWGVVNASMIARMMAAHHEAAKLDDVDRLILETAVSL
ncbi:hypothetical protein V8E36_008965 [Tilletia maclaganii]